MRQVDLKKHAESNRLWRKNNPEYKTNWNHKKGICGPMAGNKDCPQYLGIYTVEKQVAESILSKIFEHIEWMSFGNRGFDCNCDGQKIEVKSSSRLKSKHGSEYWQFNIHQNPSADRFILFALNDRVSLEIQHAWLIPGNKINHYKMLAIYEGEKSLSKWSQYEVIL
jgi:hypothetical protein